MLCEAVCQVSLPTPTHTSHVCVWSVCLSVCGLLCLVCVCSLSLSVCGLLCLVYVGVDKDRKSVGAVQCDYCLSVWSVCLCGLYMCGLLCLVYVGVGKDCWHGSV